MVAIDSFQGRMAVVNVPLTSFLNTSSWLNGFFDSTPNFAANSRIHQYGKRVARSLHILLRGYCFAVFPMPYDS